ncbi:hypothetical protein V6305_09230 [Serratia marcescens]|uniref:hypothetical protein n=1 Tax=Serratia marcescens TaxID=615 RepID=UPI0036FD0C4D
MTLTTEQLRARAKFWREKAVEAKWESVSIAQDMLQNADAFDELAANREAQPVGYFVRHRSAWGRPSKWRLWTECSAEDYAEFCKIIATGEDDAGRFYEARILYTALPAPANANAVAWEMRYWNSGHNMWHDWERITAEQHAEMSVQHAADNDYEFRVLYDAPPEPAVPDSLANDIDSYDHPLLWSYNNGWNACRAAMLAQPVSSGYTLPDSVLVLLNHIEDVLDDENWNRISVEKWNAVTMLAAAPEGGN